MKTWRFLKAPFNLFRLLLSSDNLKTNFYQKKDRAFTLLEICLVLFIIAITVGATIPVTSGLFKEERLREPVRTLQLYAKTARNLAMSEQRPYEIKFESEGFSLQAVEEEKENAAHSTNVTTTLHYTLSDDVELSLKRWQEKKFHKLAQENWIFQPTGLCEPLYIRLVQNETWIEIGFNPLTANIQEESFSF